MGVPALYNRRLVIRTTCCLVRECRGGHDELTCSGPEDRDPPPLPSESGPVVKVEDGTDGTGDVGGTDDIDGAEDVGSVGGVADTGGIKDVGNTEVAGDVGNIKNFKEGMVYTGTAFEFSTEHCMVLVLPNAISTIKCSDSTCPSTAKYCDSHVVYTVNVTSGAEVTLTSCPITRELPTCGDVIIS